MKYSLVIRNTLLVASCMAAIAGFIVNAEAQPAPRVVVVPSEETGNPAANPETPNTTVPDKVAPPIVPGEVRTLNEEKSGTTAGKGVDGRSDSDPSPTTPRQSPAWNGVDGKAD